MSKQENVILEILKKHQTPFLQDSCLHSNHFEEVAKEIATELGKKG